MSYVKGRRKTSVSKPVGIKLGKYLLPSNVAIPALMAFLFVVIAVAITFEPGFDALILWLTGFGLFAALAYAVRSRLKVMNIYVRLIDAFAAIFAVMLIWSVVRYVQLFGPSSPAISSIVIIAVLNLLVAIVLIAGLLYFEKDRPSRIYAQAGQFSRGLTIGIPVLIAGIILALILAYLIFGAAGAEPVQMLTMLAILITFSLATGIAGEAWFRGLFLSRLLPIAGNQAGYIIQAVIFAFFQAVMYYMFTSSLLYAGGILVVSAIIGYLFAHVTVKTNSLVAAILSGTGANIVLALPLFAVLLGA